jgi:hypothetical protein
MNQRWLFILLFFLPLLPAKLSAQCKDSSLIQYGAYCDPRWEPVCGCDGFTYQNDCFARNAGLLYWNYTICDPVDFSFTPNPPSDHIDVDVLKKEQGTIYVELVDRFGKVFYSNVFLNITRYQFQIDVRGFPTGIYYLHIYCDNGSRVKKVLVPGVY